jgi:hypothetical protein
MSTLSLKRFLSFSLVATGLLFLCNPKPDQKLAVIRECPSHSLPIIHHRPTENESSATSAIGRGRNEKNILLFKSSLKVCVLIFKF